MAGITTQDSTDTIEVLKLTQKRIKQKKWYLFHRYNWSIETCKHQAVTQVILFYSTDTIEVLKHAVRTDRKINIFDSTDTIEVLKPIFSTASLTASSFHRYNWSIETLKIYKESEIMKKFHRYNWSIETTHIK